MKRICVAAEDLARDVLNEHMDELHAVSEALLEYETLSGDEVHNIVRGETIVRKDDDDTEQGAGGSRSSVPTSGRPLGGTPDPEPGPAE